jgi:hypothetical protein
MVYIIDHLPYSQRFLITGSRADSVAFRLANEVAGKGGQVLYLSRGSLSRPGSEGFPHKADLIDANSRSFQWSVKFLKKIDIVFVNSATELKRIAAIAHTASPAPDLIIVEDFSGIIDPLRTVLRTDHSFQHTALQLRCYLDDAAASISRLNEKKAVKIVIIDDVATTPVASIIGDDAVHLNAIDSSHDTAFVEILRPHGALPVGKFALSPYLT